MVWYGYLSCLLCMLHFPLVGPFPLQALALYQTPESLRVLRSISAVASTALFWTEILDVVGGICCLHSPHPLQLLSQSRVFLRFLLPDVAVVGFSVTCLSVCIWKSPRMDLHHLWRSVPHWPGSFHSKPVHYNSFLVITFHVGTFDISKSS